MVFSTQPAGVSSLQVLPTMAALRAPRSLQTRLLVAVAVSVALVIGIEGYVELLLMERAAKDDLLEMGRLTAQAVADDVELRGTLFLRRDLEDRLHEFVEEYPAIREIAIVGLAGGGTLSIEASTLLTERPEVLTTARRAFERGDVVLSAEGRPLWMAAVPIIREQQPDRAVVVGVSFASLERLRVEAWIATLWFAPAAIVILTVAISLLTRRLVHRPINAIIETIQQAGGGNLHARAPVERPDEIGAIASGLNAMLSELEQLNTELHARVDETTSELRQRNQDLIDSYQRMFTLRETLTRAEQMAVVGQIAASTAHHVGTPLNLISGYVQLMMQSADGKTLERLRTIEAQVAKVTAAVHTLLDTARRPAMSTAVVDLAPVVHHLVDTVRPVLEAARIQLIVDVREPVPPISMDPAHFELVLFNLIGNNIDAMPDGGTIRVTLEARGGGVRLEVSDTGQGITPELLPHVFDAWVTTKPRGKGTGLGLSIVRDVVQAHGGAIRVHSESGRGAAFTIEWPAAAILVAAADNTRGTSIAPEPAEEAQRGR